MVLGNLSEIMFMKILRKHKSKFELFEQENDEDNVNPLKTYRVDKQIQDITIQKRLLQKRKMLMEKESDKWR